MKGLIISLAPLILLSSCYSYRIFPKAIRDYTYSGPRQRAYVLNPELKKEYKILLSSNVFDIATDSAKAAIKVRLYPMRMTASCGQPITGSLITLGQVPVLLPDRYQYRFDIISNEVSTPYSTEMQIATHVWFWDMFVFDKKFKKKAGQVLLANYYSTKTPARLVSNVRHK